MSAAAGMRDAAVSGRFALQHCAACGHAQYPPREVCAACLSDRLEWQAAEAWPGVLLARTVLHHSHEERFRARLPLGIGLVRLAAGPVVVCFVPAPRAIGDAVNVRATLDETGTPVLTAG